METLVITIRDPKKRDRIERVHQPDEATLLAQPSLSEEWDSPEDQRWDAPY